jgi:AbiTii
MQLVGEIVDLAVDDKTRLSVLLRKCLVLAHRLKNERLKAWAEKELDGYAADDALPDYRRTHTLSKGLFFSPGWRMEDSHFLLVCWRSSIGQ